MEEPFAADLIAAHCGQIDALLHSIQGWDSGGTCIVDELYVLRFLLADPVNAERNLKACLEWRQRNRDILIEASKGHVPFEEGIQKNVKKGVCGWLGGQYLISVVRAGHGNPSGIMRDLTYEQALDHLLFHNEYLFTLVDQQTRRTGRLCKVITVLDLQGFSMLKFDRRFAKASGESTHLTTIYYPQLTKTVVLINLPATFRILHSFAMRFASRATLDAQKLCPARTSKGSAVKCPFLSKFGDSGAAAVPSFLGGTFPTPNSLRLNEDEMEVDSSSELVDTIMS